MNEERKSFYDYMNKNVSEQKIDATDLSMQMLSFVRSCKLAPEDWMFVNKLIKQLNKQKNNVPHKLLRSIRSKFEKVQDKYQR